MGEVVLGINVYKAINNVTKDLASQGVGKNQTNNFDRYQFRGIDDIYNALAPLLAKHGLVIMPRVLERVCQERQSKKGDLMLYVVVTVEYDLISAEDGSIHTVRMVGEAMDRSDKATTKALSAAFKYLCFQAFCIPVEGTPDADHETPQIAQVPIDEALMALTNLNDMQQVKLQGRSLIQNYTQDKQLIIDAVQARLRYLDPSAS